MANTEVILRYIVLYFGILTTFCISGIIVNIIQCILYLTLRPLSKYLYRKINYYLCYSFYCQMVCAAEWYSRVELIIYVDKNDFKKYFGKEHALIVMNHRYEVDWLLLGTICDKIHCAGNFKAYIKKIAQYVPALGWCLYFSENIFLERSFEKDKENIQRQIKEIMDHPDPTWIVLCPEGTRLNQQKYEKSLQFAKEKGLPELKHHLTPRPKGFLTSLPVMKDKIGAIYDVTLSFNPKDPINPTMLNVLLGYKTKASFYIRRIPIANVPTEEEEATKFLNDLFIRKDKLLDSFFKTGDYFNDPSVVKYEPIKLHRNYLTLVNTFMWFMVVLLPIWYYLGTTLFLATIYTKCIVFVGLIVFCIVCSRVIEINSLKKSEDKVKKH